MISVSSVCASVGALSESRRTILFLLSETLPRPTRRFRVGVEAESGKAGAASSGVSILPLSFFLVSAYSQAAQPACIFCSVTELGHSAHILPSSAGSNTVNPVLFQITSISTSSFLCFSNKLQTDSYEAVAQTYYASIYIPHY